MTSNELILEMLNSPSQSIILDLGRTPEAIERDGEDRTFSLEAIQNVTDHIHAWIFSRIARKNRLEKTSPKQMEIEVTVKLDGEPLDVITAPFTLSPILRDGQIRWEIVRKG